METKPNDIAPKVVIVGGSIAGLALGLMLQRIGVDFVILEAYREIAPQAGASIALLPNGIRVLDQLGCWEDIYAAAEKGTNKFTIRYNDMSPILVLDDLEDKVTQRLGYGLIFLDRRMVIEVLYNHILDKSKVITSQKVVSVESYAEGVKVLTNEGSEFTGDMVLGCDGVHSTVRKEIAKLEGASQENQLKATYCCVWGIATDVPHVPRGTLVNTYGNDYSYLFADGPGNRVYCALLMRMKETYAGDAIPKFTSDDEAEMAKLHEDDLILPGVKFGDVHRRMIARICTPLAEVVFKKWHSGRLMLVGDSAHKFEPLSGQGGNNAIETAAAFTNALNRALKENPNRRLGSGQISEVFKSTQLVREPRVSRLVKASHDQQNIEASQASIQTAISSQFIKILSEEMQLAQFGDVTLDAISLDMLPIPNRPRRIAWHDERHRQPVSRGWLTVFLVFAFLGISFIGANLLWGAGFANGTFDLSDLAYRSGRHYNGDLAIQAFTSSGAIDEFFGQIVAFFYPAATSSLTSPTFLTVSYLLVTVFALVPLVLVEG
ncbi:FAD-dependent monooxygenase andE [Colletotrichum higginsianum]|uniref:FAD-dependent monooxygenase andE n=1 Tax=Colletotrichum higginsianum TaxID=80884 RepID=A0A4T0VTX1_9PEZI|nr:FAD-dependent monooxygenase andE [Colletotrichum higginsianum]